MKRVKINQGEVYCLPSRIAHSPQRPEEGSLGLVVERERYEADGELDGLRWYVDFEAPQPGTILYEKFFHCGDLGRDLVPVVKGYHASEEKNSRVPGDNVCDDASRPFVQDCDTVVPDPFSLQRWLDDHRAQLDAGECLDLFHADGEHPDKEFKVLVCGGGIDGSMQACAEGWSGDTWFYQIKGSAVVSLNGADETNSQQLLEGVSGIVAPNTPYTVKRAPGSIGLVVTNDPKGNKQ